MRQFDRWAAGALALGAILLASGANAESGGVKLGTLTCHVESGWGYVLVSSKQMRCDYEGASGRTDHYVGSISKFGVDIGYTRGATLVWGVVAPTFDVGPGALQGDYMGATASATVIDGVGANALVGGLDRSVALQPVSIEGNTGYFDVAAGVGEMHLHEAEEPRPVAVMQTQPPQMMPRRYAVFFDFNRSELTPEARAVVKAAANSAETYGAMVSVHVAGHTDTVGSDSYNLRLSMRRAISVKIELVADGLNPTQIAVEGRGFHDPLVPTGPGIREPQNRSAVIDVGNPVVGENAQSLTRPRGSL